MPPRPRRLEQWSLRAYRLLLGFYPPEVRAEYGREMCLVFVDRCREQASGAGLLVVFLRAAASLVLAAPEEHIHMIAQDLRYAGRMLRKSPVVTAVTVVVLALGIGATTVVFSLANGLLVRPLPYPHPEQLVAVDESAPQHNMPSLGVAFPNYQDLRARNSTLVDLALYTSSSATLTGAREGLRIAAAQATDGIFRVLGLRPQLGRVFQPEEGLPNAPRVCLLGDRLWHDQFGADPSLLGKSIHLDGRPVTVVGVMPAGFHFPDQAELWLPLRLSTASQKRTDHWLEGIARLKSGVSLALADQQLKSIMRQIARENPVTSYDQTVNVLPFRAQITSSYRSAVLTLLGAVLGVLLIACANIANLLLVQAVDRTREIAVRSALGASRGRLLRQLLIESLLLGGLGAAAGLGLALVGIPCLLALIPVELPSWMRFGLDLRVLAFTVAAAVVTSLLISLAPAHVCSRLSLTETLKEGGRSGLTGLRGERIRRLLIVGEVALSLTLLIGAGLMARSFLALSAVPAGFDPRRVLTLEVAVPQVKYHEAARKLALTRRVREEVAGVPEVTGVAAACFVPLMDAWGRSLTVEGHRLLSLKEAPMVNHTVVTPGYFRALGIPMIEGRDFTEADGKDRLVAIVDQDLARRYWPHASALGKRVRFGPPEDNEPWHTIVGVAGVVRNQTLLELGRSSVYLSFGEIPNGGGGLSLIVRSAGDPLRVAAAVRRRIVALDRDLAVSQLRSMEQVVAISIWRQRFFTILFVAFAALALLLAAVGLYGVMSYAVSRRRRELGLRVALGARAGDLRRLVVGQAVRLTLLGLALGGAGALALTRLLSSQLYEVKPTDPSTYEAMAALLVVVTVLASALPASQAARSDPILALRDD
ncbi:MAG TPA: ABC transporter permease [Thermoanaerobaculia bacterium]|nr:ABC transporter permease [Thermoanaerobaculia bacterium]